MASKNASTSRLSIDGGSTKASSNNMSALQKSLMLLDWCRQLAQRLQEGAVPLHIPSCVVRNVLLVETTCLILTWHSRRCQAKKALKLPQFDADGRLFFLSDLLTAKLHF